MSVSLEAQQVKQAAEKLNDSLWQQQTAVLLQLRKTEREKRYAPLDPRESKFLRYWDVLMGLALVYTAIVTPFEISFVPPDSSPHTYGFITNRLLDGLFFIDLLLQFNIKYYDEPQNLWVRDRRLIASAYLRSWFLLDVGSLAPSTADYVLLANYAAGKEGESPSTARIFRIIRVVRLLKLLRLLRSSRVFSRMLSRFPLPYKTLVMLRLSLLVTLAAHWSACLLSISTTFSEQGKLDTWLASYGYCWPVQSESDGDGELVYVDEPTQLTWIEYLNHTASSEVLVRSECAHFLEIYLASFEWGLLLISGVDVEPAMGPKPPVFAKANKLLRHEVGMRTLLLTLGALIWCYVTAAFVEVIVNTDPNAVELRNQMTDLNGYIASARLPKEVALRLREYLYKTKHVAETRSRRLVLEKLSVALQGEVALLANEHWLAQVPIFTVKDPAEAIDPRRKTLLSAVALALEGAVYAPSEWLPGNNMYLLERGLVCFGGQVYGTGRVWGWRSMTYTEWQPHKTARALTYVELNYMPSSKIRHLAEQHDPATAARIRWYCGMEALRGWLLWNLRKQQSGAGRGVKNSIKKRMSIEPFASFSDNRTLSFSAKNLESAIEAARSRDVDSPAQGGGVAAKEELDQLTESVSSVREELKTEMTSLREEMKAEMAKVHEEMAQARNDIAGVAKLAAKLLTRGAEPAPQPSQRRPRPPSPSRRPAPELRPTWQV